MPPQTAVEDPALEWLERLLDRAFRIPGTDMHFGLDGLLGLIPGVGDTATAAISGAFIVAAIQAGASRRVVLEMAWNVVLDWLLGAIPLVGDIFDFANKANTKNLRLLRQELARLRATAP